jgi:hypothetical protein
MLQALGGGGGAMPITAKKHFDEDIGRARALLEHAKPLPAARADEVLLRNDIFRSAWMYAVGAMDAYFCDAYVDMLARLLRAKNMQSNLHLTSKVQQIALPVGTIMSPPKVRDNWKWRNAAKDMLERDNMISVEKIRDSFNPFLRFGHKLFEASTITAFVDGYRPPQRLLGMSASDYRKLAGKPLEDAQKAARRKITGRYQELCQRRHDCIHNCDRPKATIQGISETSTDKALNDIEMLVSFCDSHFEDEFNQYLRTAGATSATRNSTGYGT